MTKSFSSQKGENDACTQETRYHINQLNIDTVILLPTLGSTKLSPAIA
jgi:hypothetical protein